MNLFLYYVLLLSANMLQSCKVASRIPKRNLPVKGIHKTMRDPPPSFFTQNHGIDTRYPQEPDNTAYLEEMKRHYYHFSLMRTLQDDRVSPLLKAEIAKDILYPERVLLPSLTAGGLMDGSDFDGSDFDGSDFDNNKK